MVETIATVAGTLVAFLVFAGAFLRWFYQRGRNEQAIANSIERQAEATANNTAATVELSGQIGGLRDTLMNHQQQLTEHHFRLKALEEREVRVTVK